MHASKEKNQLNKIKLGRVSFACYLHHIEKPLKEKISSQGVFDFDGFSTDIYSKMTSAKAREHLTKYIHSLRKIANEKATGKRIDFK